QEALPQITAYQGKLGNSATDLYNMFVLQDALSERLGKLFTYAHMRNDEDTTNDFYQALNLKAENLLTHFSSQMSFIVPEIIQMDEETLEEFLQEKPELQHYKKTLDEISRQRKHVLSEQEEVLLSEASDALSNSSQVFGMLNNADLTFPSILNENGEEVDVTHGRYIGFMESKDREVRKAAFHSMYDTFGNYRNTFAATLNGNVKKNNFYAKARMYDSARQAALDSNKIPESVYDNLVDAINEKLPLLHRYADLRKRLLDVDELHMYDLYTPLVKDIDMTFTYEEAKDIVLKSLEPLGQEYVSIVQE